MQQDEQQQQQEQEQPERPRPLFTSSLNALRTTYMSLFNQMITNSLSINCLCKTTKDLQQTAQSPTPTSSFATKISRNPFDRPASDFMDDDDDDDDDDGVDDATTNGNTNGGAVANENAAPQPTNGFLIPSLCERTGKLQLNRTCDLSCFESLKFMSCSLKRCFDPASGDQSEEASKFDAVWSSFALLAERPQSCDYYGTTVFHYAAADNAYGLLRCALRKYPAGHALTDSKGMTPLMRAVQRNNLACVQLLLDETESELNGNALSAYTPIWFAVSNGYNECVLMLLNHDASPSIVVKTPPLPPPPQPPTANHSSTSSSMVVSAADCANQIDILLDENDDHIGLRGLAHLSSPAAAPNTLYLFSPLRASIVYARFKIMNYLLEFGANVYELFGVHHHTQEADKSRSHSSSSSSSQQGYASALKFFYKQFGSMCKPLLHESSETTTTPTTTTNECAKYLSRLNEFIETPNVYRRMLLTFVRDVCAMLTSSSSSNNKGNNATSRSNQLLVDNFNSYCGWNGIDSSPVRAIVDMIDEHEQVVAAAAAAASNYDEWLELLSRLGEFMALVDSFMNRSETNGSGSEPRILSPQRSGPAEQAAAHHNKLLKKTPHYYENCFQFGVTLMNRYGGPRSLKQLCRFQSRRLLMTGMAGKSTRGDAYKYKKEFLKMDHLRASLASLSLPSDLNNYLLYA